MDGGAGAGGEEYAVDGSYSKVKEGRIGAGIGDMLNAAGVKEICDIG